MQNLNNMALARLAELTKHANRRETFGLPNKAHILAALAAP